MGRKEPRNSKTSLSRRHTANTLSNPPTLLLPLLYIYLSLSLYIYKLIPISPNTHNSFISLSLIPCDYLIYIIKFLLILLLPCNESNRDGEQVVGCPKTKTAAGGFLTFCAKAIGKSYPNPTPIQSPARQYNNSSSSSSRESSSSSSSSSSSDQLEQVFTYFDEDGDGKISASELQTCLRAVGSCNLSDEDAEEAVRSSDADGDGMLGFNDFAKLMETAGDDDKFQELKEAFGMYSDDDGEYITSKSLKKMLTRLGQLTTMSSCKAMISQFDLNGDGRLSFEEFRMMMH